ncbi:MAG TPA: hypothetical protein VFL54_03065 [Gammaproteobacteria bacterium]|nr:hypothetical protein [Gammaproteobacteria bacterium]
MTNYSASPLEATGALGDCHSSVDDISKVQAELNALAASNDVIEKISIELEKRLTPVLRPSNPEKTTGASEAKESCLLVTLLYKQRVHLDAATERLLGILNRLEL